MPIGCKVTLRGNRMYEFADKLINIALPRVRDFRGVSAKSFDGRGNYSLGIKEQLIFPEIEYDKIEKVRGMDIIFVTTAKTDEEARELLKFLGMPFAQVIKEGNTVARKAMIEKWNKELLSFQHRAYTRCRICGRPHAVFKKIWNMPYLF